MVSPITIAVKGIKCIEETNEGGSDEPYVLVVVIDLQPLFPNVEIVLYGPWNNVDTGESHDTAQLLPNVDPKVLDTIPLVWRKPFWGLSGQPAAINNPDHVIFLVALMENDDGNPKWTREFVKVATTVSLGGSTALITTAKDTTHPETAKPARQNLITKLIQDINVALDIPTGILNFDDQVDEMKELLLTSQDLAIIASTGVHTRNLLFNGDGGNYDVFFELKRG